jgi:DNA polymerase-3 subunit gamma/tau
MMAAEMAIIRLTHVADLPSPEELIRKLQNAPSPAAATGAGSGVSAAPSQGESKAMAPGRGAPDAQVHAPQTGARAAAPAPAHDVAAALARYPTFEHVVELIRANRDGKLLADVETDLRLVAYQLAGSNSNPPNARRRISRNGSVSASSSGRVTAGP